MRGRLRISRFLKVSLAFLLPFTFLLSIYFTNFNAPFRTTDEDNGYLFGGVARSHLLLGLRKTYGQDFFYEGPNEEPTPYLHHPPGVGLSLALILRFLNFGDLDRPFWQERLLPTLYTITIYFLLFFLAHHFFKSLKAAFIAVSLFVLMPMSLYYGRMVSHEPPTLFFLMLTAFLYLKFRENKRRFVKYVFFITLFLSCLYGWPGFYFIPVVLFLDFVDFKKKRLKTDKFFWQLAGFEVILLLLFLGQIYLASESFFDFVSNLVSEKNALPPIYGDPVPYFKIGWLRLLWGRYLRFFTPIVAIPGGMYLAFLALRFVFFASNFASFAFWERVSLLFFFISLIHIFVWRCGSYHLPYWQIYFLPALIFSVTHIYLLGERLFKKIIGTRVWFFPVSLLYYLLIFYILIRQSQPLVWDLYTKTGEFLFLHFYVTGF